MHNDQIPFCSRPGGALGAQRGLAAALDKLVKTHNNIEVKAPLKLSAENGNWVLSLDPAYGGGSYSATIRYVASVGTEASPYPNYKYLVISQDEITVANGLVTAHTAGANVSRILIYDPA